tara:strand:+ start:819 stop:1499 length:681 start_codon:yes stop_codon:yes gene_type:complete
MNCLRSLEYIKQINDKYKRYGLKTILIHPPEWEFEKDSSNILKAAKKYKIKIPILIDNNKKLVKKLKINFWPTQVLINNNKTAYKHVGEGNYKILENKIRGVLGDKSKRLFEKEPKYTKFQTLYTGKKKQRKGSIIKKGNWKQNNESLQGKGSLTIKTKGKIVSFVARSLINKTADIKIRINNKSIKNLKINEPRLYKIIELKSNEEKTLNLETKQKITVYSFAFQ